MYDLSAIVQRLKKERANAQQMVARLDAALRALKHLGGGDALPRRRLSLAARRKIAAAQRARWARVKKQKAA